MKNNIQNLQKWSSNKKVGEVYTPSTLVENILDQIPEIYWIDKSKKFLDPCFGTGTFIFGIITRLVTIYGYTYKDAIKKVYGFDIRVKYVNFITRKGIYNVEHSNFLNYNREMKFDVILGNPPYQESTVTYKDKNNKQGGLWWKIMKQGLDILQPDGLLIMVVPTSLFSAGGFGTNTHKISFLNKSGFKIHQMWKSVDEHFDVGIKISVVSIKQKKDNLINIVDLQDSFEIDYTLPIPFDLCNISYNIAKKCINLHNKWSFTEKDFSVSDDSVVKINGGRFKKYEKTFVGLTQNTQHKAQTMIIDPSKTSYFESIFKSNLFKFIFKIYGGEDGQSSTGILQRLPLLPATKIWTNTEIYNHFDLDEVEIDFIENYGVL